MITKTINELAAMCGGSLGADTDGGTVVSGVTTDTRRLLPGSLFVPLKGENFDGHAYAAGALADGAAATLWEQGREGAPAGDVILVDEPLAALQRLAAAYNAEVSPRVIAVTGSNGKTTTKDMVAAMLETTYKIKKTEGNFNNHIGLPLTILGMAADTELLVLEMGMSGRGEIELLSKLGRPELAVITNIGESHLLQLGSRKEIARAKLEIVAGLKPGGTLVYNGEEPLLEEVLSEPSFEAPDNMKRFRFGLSEVNDDYPTGIMNHPGYVTFTTHVHDTNGTVFTLPVQGAHNVVNALAALAVGRLAGLSDEAMQRGLDSLKLTGMRSQTLRLPSGLTLLNDAYNASPTSMKAAIDMLRSIKTAGKGRRIAVLGDMLELGPEQERYHAEVGAYAGSGAIDLLFSYGPLSAHAAEAAAALLGPGRVFAFRDKEELADALISAVLPADIVLFKASRGMKLEDVLQKLAARHGG